MGDRMFLMQESAYYELMDYVEAHLAERSVLAVQMNTDEAIPAS